MVKPMTQEPVLHPRKLIVLMTLLMVLFVCLAGRCFMIQHLRSTHYTDLSLSQQKAFQPYQGARGAVLDCRGRVLAADHQTRLIFADPQTIARPIETATTLASLLEERSDVICQQIIRNRHKRFVRVKSDVEWETCLAADKLQGIGVQPQWHRDYPMGALGGHVVGFVSSDGRGLAGIEYQFDRELAGDDLREVFLADVRRRPIRPLSQLMPLSPSTGSGCGIVLTIDAAIQGFVRHALLEQFTAYEAESAYAVVADPKTGAILAMVSLPDFDPAHANRADPNTFINHAVQDGFEPGSVLKPIIMSIALDAGVVSKEETIFCENGHYIGKGFGHIKEYSYHQYGDMTPKEIVVESSNIGMAKIGQRLGPQRLYKSLRCFGFGRKTGIPLSMESEGLLRPPDQWTGYSVTRIPFGQEICVSALQLIKAFCILANHGRLVKPHLIQAFVDGNGVPVMRDAGYKIANQIGYVIDPDIADYMVQDVMTGVVNEGTGTKARLKEWQVFGKTGTAQIAGADGKGYEDGAYIASFIAGAPAQNPSVVVLVSIRRPNTQLNKGYTGGTVAAPVAGRILKKTLRYLESKGHVLVKKQPPVENDTRL